MATIINNPSSTDENGVGFFTGALLALAVVGVFFFIYGLSGVRNGGGETTDTIPERVQIEVMAPVNN